MCCIFWAHRLYFKALYLPVYQGLQDMRQEVIVESLEFCVSWICYVGEPQLQRKQLFEQKHDRRFQEKRKIRQVEGI